MRRLISQGAVKFGEEIGKSLDEIVKIPANGIIIKVGKRQWFKAVR
jgi:hypothetical protein